MPDQPKKFYLTTPIYYVNARPHIGHAYSTIVADVLARRHRLLGPDGFKNTYFLTGTDEHGQKIERAAAAAGIPPQQYADQVSATFRALWDRMGITYNQFIRTTDPKHITGAQKLFADLYARGQIYLDSYTGQYSVGEEMFVEGPPGTLGPDGRPTETVTEENFFFRLSDYQLPLLNLIESNQLLITPDSSRNEVLAFLRGNTTATSPPSHESVILSEGAGHHPAPQPKDPEAAQPTPTAGPISTSNPPSTLAQTAAGTPYVPGALRDLSVSRSSFTWGIPVPEPAASTTTQKHVIYVWLDALANYMTALGYGSEDDALWQKYWPADIHLVGKEITRFHCVYWPAFLLAAGLPVPKQVTANGWLLFDNSKMSKSKGNVVRTETILDAFGTLCPPPAVALPNTHPNSVILSEGAGHHPAPQPKDPETSDSTPIAETIPTQSTLSTESNDRRGTASAVPSSPTQTPASAAEAQPHDRDLFAADILRYYLLREIPFGQDGSFSFDTLITRYNADLANGYGNLVSRTLNMIHKYFDGSIPENSASRPSVIGDIIGNISQFDYLLSEARFAHAIEVAQNSISIVDIDITASAPWKSGPDETLLRQHRASILYTAAESIRIITALLYPILPYATARVWAQLGLGDIEVAARNGDLRNLKWGGLQPGTKLGPLSPIFPRADKGLAQIMTDMENPPSSNLETSNLSPVQNPSSTAPDAAPRTSSLDQPTGTLTVAGSTALTTAPDPLTTPHITIDDFAKIELRVAQILLAERIPKADKLLRLEVDLGPEGRRQILSGIAEWYTPEDLLHRKIVVITNLAPRKMRGLESHGMLLAASEEGGKPILATFAEDIPNGTRLK